MSLHIYCRFILFVITIGLSFKTSGQTRLILNGGILTMQNGATIVIDNSASNAITRFDGHIVGENESNIIRWNLQNATGTYTIPWGTDSTYLPLVFTKSAGIGSGWFNLSTYRTGWQNSLQLPSGVTNLIGNGVDNSAKVLDRFWQIDAVGYSQKPRLTDVAFTYTDVEFQQGGNQIAEAALGAQRWNDDSLTWGDLRPIGVAVVNENKVTVTEILPEHLFKWWTLVDNAIPLPLQFLTVKAFQSGTQVVLQWTVQNQMDAKYYEVQKLNENREFVAIQRIQQQDRQSSSFFSIDSRITNEFNQYRIKATSLAGVIVYSPVVQVRFSKAPNIEVFPNPVKSTFIIRNLKLSGGERIEVRLFDAQMKKLPVTIQRIGNDEFLVTIGSVSYKGVMNVQVLTPSKSFTVSLLKE